MEKQVDVPVDKTKARKEPGYLARMREEARELDKKLQAATRFALEEGGTYENFDDTDRVLFDEQIECMARYSRLLDARIAHDELKEAKAARPAKAAPDKGVTRVVITGKHRRPTVADIIDLLRDIPGEPSAPVDIFRPFPPATSTMLF